MSRQFSWLRQTRPTQPDRWRFLAFIGLLAVFIGGRVAPACAGIADYGDTTIQKTASSTLQTSLPYVTVVWMDGPIGHPILINHPIGISDWAEAPTGEQAGLPYPPDPSRAAPWMVEGPLPPPVPGSSPPEWTGPAPVNASESDAALPSAEEMLRDSVPLNRPQANEIAVPTPGAYFYEGLGWQNSGHSWLLASGDGFGMFSIGDMNLGLRKSPSNHGDLHWAIYWLNGPTTTDMPPRLFDLALTWSEQHQVTDDLSLQYTISAGFYSDFRASAREGVRFPGWFVFRYGATEWRQWILGIDILDRRDVFCLPVGGVVLAPTENLRMELVFPRPRLMWRPSSKRWLYVRGEMGGGTWSIDRTMGTSDLATYRDLRALAGITSDPGGMGLGSLEVGYVFDRSLDYRSGVGDYEPHNAWVIQTVCSF